MTAVATSGSGHISAGNLPAGWVSVRDWKYSEDWHGPIVEQTDDMIMVEVWGKHLAWFKDDLTITYAPETAVL
jgi:hypothetical protein